MFSNLFSSRKLKIFQCENLIFAIWEHRHHEFGAQSGEKNHVILKAFKESYMTSHALVWHVCWTSVGPVWPIEHTRMVLVLRFPFFFSFHAWQVLGIGYSSKTFISLALVLGPRVIISLYIAGVNLILVLV